MYSTIKSVTVLVTMWAFLLLSNFTKNLNAYDLSTHQAIAERTISVTSLSSYLRDQLGLRGGVAETLLGQRVDQWINSGAQSEDIPAARVRHHFHNPLRPWAQAGLTFGIPLGESSLLWNQEPRQDSYWFAGSGSWSWHNARKQYLDALTRSAKTDREKSFADLFRSLGQGTHLLQDATVPAHVRDDPHLNVLVPFIKIYFPDPDGYEKWALNNGPTAGAFIGLEPKRPPSSIFTATGDSRAPSPVARLFDTDKFQAGNSTILSDPGLGIAEFTNGNFLSKSTIFSDFTLPRATDLTLNQPIQEIVNGSVERYFSKSLQTGETVTHFVREGMLRKALRTVNLSPSISSSWVLDDRVHEDYARLLLPRAVGYSASLLDYFFRGKLEVDIFRDPTDPSIVHLEGVNASTETLNGGTLELYADNQDGDRTRATPLGATTITANPGQQIVSTTFQTPPNTERFIAVYKGKLGDEMPQGDFPGAVIGKVLGGVRVEELFSDGTRWNLRTPKGIYSLPILAEDVEELRWGDNDNTLVGRSALGQGALNTFYAYTINRPLGSVDVPLRDVQLPLPDQPPGTQEVDVQLQQQATFPFGLNTATLEFRHDIRYAQYIPSYEIVRTLTWVTDSQGNGNYVLTASEFANGQATRVDDGKDKNQPISLSRSYSLTLDQDSYFGSGVYYWYVPDEGGVFLTSDGRILALVELWLESPHESTRVPVYALRSTHLADGNTPPNRVQVGSTNLNFGFPFLNAALRALVDVTTGTIVTSTAPPVLSVQHETALTNLSDIPNRALVFTVITEFEKVKMIGGPNDGVYSWVGNGRDVVSEDVVASDRVNQPPYCSREALQHMTVLGRVTAESGSLNVTLDQYRPEFSSFVSSQQIRQNEGDVSAPTFCGNFPAGVPPWGFVITRRDSGVSRSQIEQLTRTRPGSSPETLVAMMHVYEPAAGLPNQGKLFTWVPQQSRTELRKDFFEPGSFTFNFINSVDGSSALIHSSFVSLSGGFDSTSTLVPLNGGSSPKVFPEEGLSDFVVLEPNFLFSTGDLKFYTLEQTPRQTALPAILAPMAGFAFGDYHTVALK